MTRATRPKTSFPSGHKFHAVARTIDGIRFDSSAEARHYCELKLLQDAREIYDLIVHPVYPLHVNGDLVCRFIPDFRFRKRDGTTIVQDVKGYMPKNAPSWQIFALKCKLLKALYGLDVEVIQKK